MTWHHSALSYKLCEKDERDVIIVWEFHSIEGGISLEALLHIA